MKLLFYGEYSGLASTLSSAINMDDITSDVFTNNGGDGFKRINTKFSLRRKNKILRLFEFLSILPKLLSYDVIIFMNSNFLSIANYGPIFLFFAWAFNKRCFLFAAGDDVEYVKCFRNKSLKPCPLEFVDHLPKNYFSRWRDVFIHNLVSHLAEKVIPISYEYEFCWKLSKFSRKVTNVLPLPIHTQIINRNQVKKGHKIKIVHGLNRPEQKGSKFIISALKKLELNYSDKVDIKIVSKLTLAEYEKFLSTCDVCLDQSITNSYGMNALLAMKQGVIVFSGNSEQMRESINVDCCPIININPDTDGIYASLVDLINNIDIEDEKIKSYRYCVDNHDSRLIARKFISIIDNKV